MFRMHMGWYGSYFCSMRRIHISSYMWTASASAWDYELANAVGKETASHKRTRYKGRVGPRKASINKSRNGLKIVSEFRVELEENN